MARVVVALDGFWSVFAGKERRLLQAEERKTTMDQNETQWDKLLKTRTTGRDDSHADQYRYPYEPTPYCVLERLANSGMIGKQNTVLDYGTGKGRVCFLSVLSDQVPVSGNRIR